MARLSPVERADWLAEDRFGPGTALEIDAGFSRATEMIEAKVWSREGVALLTVAVPRKLGRTGLVWALLRQLRKK